MTDESLRRPVKCRSSRLRTLTTFSVGAKGITFLYDAGYPHAIQAFEPMGTYFFSYLEFKPYIKRDSLLGQFLN
jgi:hypothetical protein